MRTMITYELAGSKPKRNLELVIETSCDASPATEVACRAEGGWEKAFSLVVGFGVWQNGNGNEEQWFDFLLLYFFSLVVGFGVWQSGNGIFCFYCRDLLRREKRKNLDVSFIQNFDFK